MFLMGGSVKIGRQELSRRRWLELMLAGTATVVTGRLSKLLAQPARPETPNLVLGPFYPVVKALGRDADLTRIGGRSGLASGQVIHVTGRVLNRNGDPVRNARVELWQANSYGRYVHPSDPNTAAALDPNFQGFGVQTTDAKGRYRFKTVKPGPYPARTGDWMRAPHLHFEVSGRFDRKATQMFFPDEPLNDQDRLFLEVRNNRDGLIANVSPARALGTPDELLVSWDITLALG